jgi:Domain of unknown function (DUF5664)/Domain of unknown function (DUF4406)
MKTYTKKDFHNPENLTCQQVGEEHRLLLPEEVDGRFGEDGQNNGQCLASSKGDVIWMSGIEGNMRDVTYRVSLATPLPDGTVLTSNECCWADDVVQPEPQEEWAAEKVAFAAGKVIEYSSTMCRDWCDCSSPLWGSSGHGHKYRIKPEPQKLKVYCAGPMTGHADYNFPAFFAASEFLEQQGYTAINPAQLDIDAGYPLERLKQLTPEEFQEFLKGAMKRDLDAIQSCDALVLLPGWEKSKGARAERAVAEWAGLRVGYLWMETGDGLRLTWEDAVDWNPPEAATKEYPDSDPDGWIPHVSGDLMPCNGDVVVDVKFNCGKVNVGNVASYWGWRAGDCDYNIAAWRPHQSQPKQPYNSDERAEWDVDAQHANPEYTDAPYDAIDIKFHPNDPKGAAGAKKVPMWLLPPYALQQTAWVHKLGASKYQPYNWRDTGVCATTYISAIMRHLDAWRDGEDIDPESGVTHLAHIAASCNILMDAHQCSKLIDDRSKRP